MAVKTPASNAFLVLLVEEAGFVYRQSDAVQECGSHSLVRLFTGMLSVLLVNGGSTEGMVVFGYVLDMINQSFIFMSSKVALGRA